MNEYDFKSNGDGTCTLIVGQNFDNVILDIPEKSSNGDKVISIKFDSSSSISDTIEKIFLPSTFKNIRSLRQMHKLEEIVVDSENPYFSSFKGVLFDKYLNTLIFLPPKKSGTFFVPSSVREVAQGALDNYNYCLEEIIFQEGLLHVENYSLYGSKVITLPASLECIDEKAFCGGGEYMWV